MTIEATRDPSPRSDAATYNCNAQSLPNFGPSARAQSANGMHCELGFAMMRRALILGVLAISICIARPAHAGSSGDNVLPPMSHTFFCMRYPADCVRTVSRTVGDTLPEPSQLETINEMVNSAIVPTTGKTPLVNLHWSIDPVVGDCNDYAVTKRHRLLEAGWPSSALLLAEVGLVATGEHHLVLIVRGRTADWVLDNRRSTVVRLSATHNEYVLYRVESANDPKFWTKSLARGFSAQRAVDSASRTGKAYAARSDAAIFSSTGSK